MNEQNTINSFQLVVFMCFLICLFAGCTETLPPIHNLNGNKIEPLGHGGMGVRDLLYQFNSLESIKESLDIGASGTELDVQLTADDQLLVFHDRNLETHTNGEGMVIDHKLDELTELEYDFLSLSDFKVTSLEAVLTYAGKEKIIMLDCQSFPGDHDPQLYRRRFAKAIDSMAQEYDIENTLYVESKDGFLLEAVGEINPRLKLFFQPADLTTAHTYALEHNFFGLSLSMKKVDAAYVTKSHDLGLRVALFGTNTRSKNYETIRMNPDYIQTDRLEHLVDVLRD